MTYRALTLLLISFSTVSLATTVTSTFPSITGKYIVPYTSGSIFFDTKVQFSSITSASLELVATSTDGLIQLCTDYFGNDECLNEVFKSELTFQLETESNKAWGYFTLDHPEGNIWNFRDRTILLDGKGSFKFYIYEEPRPAIYYDETILINSTVDISEVTLTIEGVVVPIPTSIILFISGLSGIIFYRNSKSFSLLNDIFSSRVTVV